MCQIGRWVQYEQSYLGFYLYCAIEKVESVLRLKNVEKDQKIPYAMGC